MQLSQSAVGIREADGFSAGELASHPDSSVVLFAAREKTQEESGGLLSACLIVIVDGGKARCDDLSLL